MECIEVKVGSKWMSNDARRSEAHRRNHAFEVIEVGSAFAKVRPLTPFVRGARERQIMIHRFRPTATGYVPLDQEPKKRGAK